MGKIGKVVGKMGLHNKAFKTTQRKLKTGEKKKTIYVKYLFSYSKISPKS